MGGGCHPPPPPPSTLILEPRRYVSSEKYFMGRCPKDEATAKNLVCKRSSSHSLEKIGKTCWWGWHPPPSPPPLAIGGLSRQCYATKIYFVKHSLHIVGRIVSICFRSCPKKHIKAPQVSNVKVYCERLLLSKPCFTM